MNDRGNRDQCTHGRTGLRQEQGHSAILEEIRGGHTGAEAGGSVDVRQMFTSMFSAEH